MIWKNTLKYPVLMIGVILFGLFLADEKTAIWWNKVNNRYIPSTCGSLVSRLESKLPDHWELECENKDRLLIEAPFSKDFKDQNILRANMFKEIVNMLHKVSYHANHETLHSLKKLVIFLNSNNLKIIASTDGQAIVKIKSFTDTKKLLAHLKLSVKTKEVKNF
jgi:hypothetical protein